MRRILNPAVAAVAAIAAGAVPPAAPAQDAGGTTAGAEGVGYFEVDDDRMAVPGLNLTVEQIEELDVVTADGSSLGEVDEVLATAEGEVVAISIDVNGLFGLGDDDVILPLDQVELFEGNLRTALTEEELEALPRWN